jgi:hypothetical protein
MLALVALAALQAADGRERDFLVKHCVDCHGSEQPKGGVNLADLDGAMTTRALQDLWTRVHDRVEAGDMPPAHKPRPAAEAVQGFLGGIRPRLFAADRARREVVHRRLNRTEYEHAVRDLLAVDADLQKFLPPDARSGGFDTNGEALAVSAEQLAAYLDAAGAALDAALVRGPRPAVESFTVDSLKEVGPYLGQKLFAHEGGKIFTFLSEETSYSKISSRDRRVPLRGRYRIRFEAATRNAKEPIAFSITASDFAPVSASYRHLGYFEAEATSRVFEFEALLDARHAVQFFAHGLPAWINQPAAGNHPGIGFGPVSITGPLYESWPPESVTRLLGSVDPEKGTLEDAGAILRRFMPRAWRRPVADAEVARVQSLVGARLKAGRTFEQALRAGLTAVLCSPNFLYLKEEARPGTDRVSDLELASRLALFLWSSSPDPALIDLASNGGLKEPAAVRAQALRMLADPRSARFVESFCAQWLRLRDIDATSPDRKLYRDFDELLKWSLVQETLGFFKELLEKDLPVDRFLDSDFAMLNRRLSRHYGVEGGAGIAVRPVKLPEGSVRGGVLTQGALLKVTANGSHTSPVTRGVWVLENILGRHIPPPPPNTPGIEPDIRGAVTIREQLDKHRSVASCNACHKSIDPPGFALESFDPVGAFRERYVKWVPHPENPDWGHVADGARVDAAGKTPDGRPFEGIRGFKRLLLERKGEFARCLTGKLAAYGLGRELGFSDRDEIAKIAERGAVGLRTLLAEIAASPLFARR